MTTEKESKEQNEGKERKEISWRTQDWIWLLAVIIYAQGLVFLHNELLMQAISYVSTFVSIALAGIAIYISIKEATNNDKMKNEIYIMLNAMRSKLGDIDKNMIKQQDFEKMTTREVIGSKQPLVSEIVKAIEHTQGDKVNIENLEELINEKVDSNFNKIINNLNEAQKEYSQGNLSSSIVVKNSFMDIVNTFDVGEMFGFDEFWYRHNDLLKTYEPRNRIKEKLSKLIETGYIEILGQYYRRIR